MDKLPVVFVHGIRLSGSMWSPVTDLLTDRATAAPDLPGHGHRRGERFTLDEATATVAAAVADLGGYALVVGHSLGGYVAIASAARHPDQVLGLVAIGCTYQPAGFYAGLFRQFSRLAAVRPELSNRLTAWGYRRQLPPAVAAAAVAGGLSCEVMPEVVDAITRSDPLTALTTYPHPVLIVNGTKDPFRDHQAAFLAACREGELRELPGRGHITCLADPEILADIVEHARADHP